MCQLHRNETGIWLLDSDKLTVAMEKSISLTDLRLDIQEKQAQELKNSGVMLEEQTVQVT